MCKIDGEAKQIQQNAQKSEPMEQVEPNVMTYVFMSSEIAGSSSEIRM